MKPTNSNYLQDASSTFYKKDINVHDLNEIIFDEIILDVVNDIEKV